MGRVDQSLTWTTASNNGSHNMLPPPRILVAEDNPAQAGAIRFCLERSGLPCTVIGNGYEAWKLLQTQDFALLLTDHQMPGLSGCELVERLRSDMRLAGLPIIMLTAKGLELDVARLTDEFRVNAVIAKPFSPRELVAAIRVHMDPTASLLALVSGR